MRATLAAVARPARAMATARPHAPRVPEGRFPVSVGGCGFHGGAVGSQNGVGVEHGDERLEVPEARGGQESLDHLLLAAPVAGAHLVAALDAPASPAGQLASRGRRPADDRRDVLERHREEVVEHEGEALRRSERLEQNQQGRANRVGEDRLFFGTGELGLGLVALQQLVVPATAGAEHPRHTRDTTVVSHPPRLSMLSASERFRRTQVSCTASSAAVKEPRMR